jgi:cytochrome c oxidase subunit 3
MTHEARYMNSHAASNTPLAHHFEDLEQQRYAGTLGMWIFLATEVLFFGGLFTAYTVYRSLHPLAFAEVSQHLDVVLGTINTAVLICSSFTMVLAVYGAQTGRRSMLTVCLAFTLVLGLIFLGIKFAEYYQKFQEHHVPGPLFSYPGPYGREAAMFFSLYFAMTGLHALHMIIGIGILGVLISMAWHGRFSPKYYNPVELSGLYWHFVDIVWIFLYPLLYLIGRHLE